MIQNDQELHATLQRIAAFQQQLEHLRRVETDPANYRLSAAGFLVDLDRMNLEVREYLATHPGEMDREASKPVVPAG
jgi:hypothetical protein